MPTHPSSPPFPSLPSLLVPYPLSLVSPPKSVAQNVWEDYWETIQVAFISVKHVRGKLFAWTWMEIKCPSVASFLGFFTRIQSICFGYFLVTNDNFYPCYYKCIKSIINTYIYSIISLYVTNSYSYIVIWIQLIDNYRFVDTCMSQYLNWYTDIMKTTCVVKGWADDWWKVHLQATCSYPIEM